MNDEAWEKYLGSFSENVIEIAQLAKDLNLPYAYVYLVYFNYKQMCVSARRSVHIKELRKILEQVKDIDTNSW